MNLEEKLDEIFSIYTRIRFADWKGYVHCYTCNWFGHWKECDAGHWISRSSEAVRWDEENARPQCRDCNRHRNGEPDTFEVELREELGDEKVDALLVRSREVRYLNEEDKKALFIHTKELVRGLDNTL